MRNPPRYISELQREARRLEIGRWILPIDQLTYPKKDRVRTYTLTHTNRGSSFILFYEYTQYTLRVIRKVSLTPASVRPLCPQSGTRIRRSQRHSCAIDGENTFASSQDGHPEDEKNGEIIIVSCNTLPDAPLSHACPLTPATAPYLTCVFLFFMYLLSR